jgi:hypothetical protein
MVEITKLLPIEQDVGNVSLDDPCDVTRDTLPFTPGIFGCSG